MTFHFIFFIPNRHDYHSVFGLDVGVGLNKGDRLIYGDSAMTHAMLFTAVSFEVILSFHFLLKSIFIR